MRYTFEIRDTQSDEVREYRDGYDWEDEGHMLYMFRDGNYSCDCNRELFFQRATGQPEPEFDDLACGEGRFVISRAKREDGTFVEIDIPQPPIVKSLPAP